MTRRSEEAVGVLDLRAGGPHRPDLDEISRSEIAELVRGGRLIVVDDASALVSHHDGYVRLAALVRTVVCVAVGPVGVSTGHQLRQSSAVRSPWVTLWVGDELGVLWSGGSDDGAEPAESGAFAGLLAQLSCPAMFDAVISQVGAIRYQTACPALRTAGPSVGAAEVRGVLAQVLRGLGVGGQRGLVSLDLPTAAPPEGDAGAAVKLHVDLQRPARPQIEWARQRIASLRGVGGLFRTGGGAGVWNAVIAAGDALNTHSEHTRALVIALQRRAEANGVIPDDGWDLPAPEAADDATIAHELRAGIKRSLAAGASLADTVAALRAVARDSGGQVTGSARRALVGLEQESVAEQLGAAPPAELPPAVLGGFAATAFVTAGVAASLPAFRTPAGVVLALIWIGFTAAVLWRRPAPPRSGIGRSAVALLTVAAAAAVGALAGVLMRLSVPVPLPVELLVDGVLVVLSGGVLVWGWTALVDRWSAGLPLASADATDVRLAALVEETLAGTYRRANTRRRLQESAELLAAGLTDVDAIFRAWAGTVGREAPTGGLPAVGQVTLVLRTDLAALAVDAVAGYFDDIASSGPLQVDDNAVTGRANLLAEQYQHYLDSGSLHRPPPVQTDAAIRVRLAEAMWQRCTPARDLLLDDLRVPMTQLCLPEDLRRGLDRDWREIRTLRFAPAAAQRVLLGAIREDVVDTTIESAGLLRLVPLRGGVVRHVQPASAGGGTTIGGRAEIEL